MEAEIAFVTDHDKWDFAQPETDPDANGGILLKEKLGICFEISDFDPGNTFLRMILDRLDEDDSEWNVDCLTAAERYCNTTLTTPLTTSALRDLLSNSKQIMFIRLLRKHVHAQAASVFTYDDFLSSSYSHCILCYDTGYYEVYSKNPTDISLLDKAIPKGMYLKKELVSPSDSIREDFVV